MVARTERARVLVLGGGLAGLAAARALGRDAVVLEAADRPGGAARSERVGEWVFDHALHVLYFADAGTKARVLALPGLHAETCPPEAWVGTAHGFARFPIQLHLAHLDAPTRQRCVAEIEALAREAGPQPGDFAALLRATFGGTLCELFFLPYNRKMWRRPLETLAPSGFQWNIQRPDPDTVRAGAEVSGDVRPSYNADGWYPRPPSGDRQRGIERLAIALAEGVEVRTSHRVVRMLPGEREVEVERGGARTRVAFEHACIATLPLPQLVACCPDVPADLRAAVGRLAWNRVITIGLALRGPRPEGVGHWEYHPDESLVFHRLICPHRFDPELAPADGWSLMAEISEPAESPASTDAEWIHRVTADARRVGALPKDARIEHARAWVVDPAYVVFRSGEQEVVTRVREFFSAHDVHVLGRYGRWEYSSMAQVMRDGFALGERLAPPAGAERA